MRITFFKGDISSQLLASSSIQSCETLVSAKGFNVVTFGVAAVHATDQLHIRHKAARLTCATKKVVRMMASSTTNNVYMAVNNLCLVEPANLTCN